MFQINAPNFKTSPLNLKRNKRNSRQNDTPPPYPPTPPHPPPSRIKLRKCDRDSHFYVGIFHFIVRELFIYSLLITLTKINATWPSC